MIVEGPLLGHVGVRVYNTVSSLWEEVTNEVTSISIDRGGSLGAAGINTVDMGTGTIVFKNVAASLYAFEVNQDIQLYSKDAPNTDTDAIFTATIADISAEYQFNPTTLEMDEYISLYLVDRVNYFSNINIDGVISSGGLGWSTWQDRIADLQIIALGQGYFPLHINSPGDLPFQVVYEI